MRQPYPYLIGGALAMRPAAYAAVNGFSNRFWGWGGEDDDLFFRSAPLRPSSPRLRPLSARVQPVRLRHRAAEPPRRPLLGPAAQEAPRHPEQLPPHVCPQSPYLLAVLMLGSF